MGGVWVGKSRLSTELRDRVGEGPSSGAVTACQRCVSERRVEAIRTAIVGRCAVYGGRCAARSVARIQWTA